MAVGRAAVAGWFSGSHQSGAGLGLVAAGALITGLLLGACGAGNGLSNDVVNNGPLSALPATDVAVETNLQTALQQVQVGSMAGAGGAAAPGTVAGPSTGPQVVSYAAPVTGVTVLAAYNNVTRDCLGLVDLSSGFSGPPVLGESSAGTYDFTAASSSPATCDAATFAAETSPPAGWPAGDPSASGWPAP